MRNCWSAVTSGPESPRESVRVPVTEEEITEVVDFVAIAAGAATQSFIAAAVTGPTVPVCEIPRSFCHCFNAACVVVSNLPVGTGKFAYAAYKIFCTEVTDVPLEPSESIGQLSAAARKGNVEAAAMSPARRKRARADIYLYYQSTEPF
ncbi:MAG: hypothetical protein JWM46_35 [Candidatus Kaiserbacteria bacterium]|nr:hypothetical protein [Candidatus Kaiserbacteria bacterium]